VSAAPARLRSLLFAPASRPDVLAKLPQKDPDGVVIDLEDAVPASAKADARPHARNVGAELADEHPSLAVYVRVNGVLTEWFDDDIASGLAPSITGVVVPKLESADQLDVVVEALEAAELAHLHVVAGVETAAGVEAVRDVFRPPVTVGYFGAEDFVADMGGVRTPGGEEVLYARSRVALAARLAGVHALDQIIPAFRDDERFLADAERGRSIGYRGKLCIHPAQVALANRVFSASPEEVDRARRLLAAYEEARARGAAAIAFEGQMIDEPLAQQARTVLANAPDATPRAPEPPAAPS
jgi:citrate lyase subunit beta / citryl-CoA lyase